MLTEVVAQRLGRGGCKVVAVGSPSPVELSDSVWLASNYETVRVGEQTLGKPFLRPVGPLFVGELSASRPVAYKAPPSAAERLESHFATWKHAERGGPGHGVVLKNGGAAGRIVVTRYTVLLLSDDGGRSWALGASTALGFQPGWRTLGESMVAELSNGDLWTTI